MSTSHPLDYDTAVSQLCSKEWAPSGTHVATRHSDEVLMALLPASRTEKGRSALGASPSAIEHLVCVLRDPLAFHERLGELAVRLLRNLCARSPPNQLHAAQCGAHELVLNCIRKRFEIAEDHGAGVDSRVMRRVLQADTKTMQHSKMKLPFFGFAVEFLVNFVTCNASNAEMVWKEAFPSLMEKMLECENHAAASAAAALVHNCIAVVPHRMADIVKIWQSEEGADKSFTEALVRQLQREADSKDEEERFSWSFMIIRRLIGASMLQDSFDALGSSLSDVVCKSKAFSPSQFVLLQVLEASVSKSAETVAASLSSGIIIPNNSLLFFAELIEAAFVKREGDILHVAASIIGSVVILTDDSDLLEQLRVRSVKVAIHVLQALAAQQQQSGANGTDEAQLPKFSVRGDSAAVGLRGVMMRLVAICCDECKPAQDSVRKIVGIPVVLNALSYEDDVSKNPYLREWAVLAVRNLTCGNAANSKEISSYELMGLQNDEELLEKTGLEAFMGEDGKPRLRVRGEVVTVE
ncbi:Ataxin-10 [Gracilaria domingensis]|nr:Ataxin-10 [Gracilaria domingensis]